VVWKVLVRPERWIRVGCGEVEVCFGEVVGGVLVGGTNWRDQVRVWSGEYLVTTASNLPRGVSRGPSVKSAT
jgi:hypothetical protein